MPFLSRYIQELGVTDTGEVALWAGITLGITPGVAALCAPLVGRVADRFGNKLMVQRSSSAASSSWRSWRKPPSRGTLRAPWAQGLLAGYGSRR